VNLVGQVVVITGSSRGFGKAMAGEFQRAGAYVVLSSRDIDSVRATVNTLPRPADALGLSCDARDLAEVREMAKAAVEKFGKIDIWINNAGISPGWGKLADIENDRWRESFDTNLLGTYNGCRVALEIMLPVGRGQVINILGAGADRPAPNQSAYGTAKAGVAMMTQTLAKEYAGTGITFNAVMPGLIWTEMLTRAEGVRGEMRSRLDWAMRVFGNPPEVPARFVREIAERDGANGKTFKMLTPRRYVPRLLREMLGAGKRNPRPWETG
jgi:NAD(P)-dependent dehydrogenase (short-subunit alcohol dehydrogenase family)